MRFFSADVEGDIQFHDAVKEAREACRGYLLDCMRKDVAGGWSYPDEDIVKICWGAVRERMDAIDIDDGQWDYDLKKVKGGDK